MGLPNRNCYKRNIYLIRGHWYGHYKAVCTNFKGSRVEVPFTDSEIWDAWDNPDDPNYRDSHRKVYDMIRRKYWESR